MSDKLVDMLCIAYAKEMKAYQSYLHAYVTVTGPMQSVYGKIYEDFMEKEMHHLEELGKKIVAMGGMPPIEYPSIEEVAAAIYKGYDETLSVLQAAEIETLEMYTKLHAAADEAGDLPLVLLIEEIIQEEEEHHDELERILIDVPKQNNKEVHEELVVDAMLARTIKVAQIMKDPEGAANAIVTMIGTMTPSSNFDFNKSVKTNVAKISASELAGQQMQGGALVGQAINFIKAALRGQDQKFISETLNKIVGKL